MKVIKLFIATLVCAAMMASCQSKEEKGAIDFVRQNLKNPESMKVDSVTFEDEPFVENYDTTEYFVSACEGEVSYFDSTKYDIVTKLTVDSIKIISNPAFRRYRVYYKATNSFNAVVTEKATVFMIDGKFVSVDEIIEMSDATARTEAYNKTFEYGIGGPIAIKVNEWTSYSNVEREKMDLDDLLND